MTLDTGPGTMPAAVPTAASLADLEAQTVALPRSADDCYDLFCDLPRIPEWLAIVRSALVTSRYADGRARHVAFLARLERASVGYSCTYSYDDDARRVTWSTALESSVRVNGVAHFQPLGEQACLMSYALVLDLADGLPDWADRSFNENPVSATLEDFRDFALRAL